MMVDGQLVMNDCGRMDGGWIVDRLFIDDTE